MFIRRGVGWSGVEWSGVGWGGVKWGSAKKGGGGPAKKKGEGEMPGRLRRKKREGEGEMPGRLRRKITFRRKEGKRRVYRTNRPQGRDSDTTNAVVVTGLPFAKRTEGSERVLQCRRQQPRRAR